MNVKHFKQRLVELERELVGRLGEEVETARDIRDDQPGAGDLGQVDQLRDEYFALAESDAAVLQAVRAALRRIEDGTYGTCFADGEPIDEKRLESIPWTPYCLKHQQELEARARIRTPTL